MANVQPSDGGDLACKATKYGNEAPSRRARPRGRRADGAAFHCYSSGPLLAGSYSTPNEGRIRAPSESPLGHAAAPAPDLRQEGGVIMGLELKIRLPASYTIAAARAAVKDNLAVGSF